MWTFEPSAALSVLEAWEKRDGLRIVRGERLDRSGSGVSMKQGRIASIRTLSGHVYQGRCFIDATYEGDLLAAAGVSYSVGRESNASYGESLNGAQPKQGYHKLKAGVDPYVIKGDRSSGLLPGIDPSPVEEGAADSRVQAYCFRMCLTDDPANRIPFEKPADYDERNYELLFRNYECGETHLPWINSKMPNRKTDTNNSLGFSSDFIGGNWRYPEASYEEREAIVAAHLAYQRGLMWTLANHPRIPEKIRAEYSRWGTCRDEFADGPGDGWQSQLYVREARRMRGAYVMTERNCRGERIAPHPVGMGAYGMDSHHVRRYVGADGFVQNEGDVEVHRHKNGEVIEPYPIEYLALCPERRECENLLVPVCLSATHIAFGSLRMEPVFFALGQAAGTAAALAVGKGCPVQDVDYASLRSRLLADGQVLGEARGGAFRLADVRVAYADSFAAGSQHEWGRLGAEDLAAGLAKVTGGDVRAVCESEASDWRGPVIWVGDTKAARTAGLNASTLRQREYRIKVEPNRAFIVASSGLGANDGCVRFLERQAGYWMMTVSRNDPFEKDPDRRAVLADESGCPAIYSREISIGNKPRFPETTKLLLSDYQRRLGVGITQEIEHWVSRKPWQCHTFYNYCRPEDWFATHPEFFSMGKDGKRAARWNNGTELCFSAPGLLETVFAALEKFIEADRKENPENPPRIYEFSQMDNCDSLCWCPDCRRTIAKYNRVPGGHKEGGDCGLQLEFINRLARKVRERHPDIMLRTFAYVSTEGVPLGIRPEENVIVRLCDLYSASDHMLPLEHPINAARLKLLKDWVAAAPNIEVWDYRLYGNTVWEGMFPEVDVDAIAADMRLFAKLGIRRILVEHEFENQPFFELNAFVESRVSRNPEADVDELVRIYCGVYGKGAEEMRQAIELLRGAIRDNPPDSIENWHSRILPWRNVDVFRRVGRLALAAYRHESAGTVARGRIAEVLAAVSLELARLYKVMPGMETKFDTAQKNALAFFDEGIRFGAVHPDDINRETAKFKGVVSALARTFSRIPDELKGVPRGELVFFDQAGAYIERMNCDRNLADPSSEVGSATKFRPLVEPSRPVQGLVWKGEVLTASPFAFEPIPDGQYHWYRLGTVRCNPSTLLYVPKGGPCYRMKDCCLAVDGQDADPNRFDVWVSAKLVGDVIATTDKTKGLFTDRLLLRRHAAGNE